MDTTQKYNSYVCNEHLIEAALHNSKDKALICP
jgi:hypothetical protein